MDDLTHQKPSFGHGTIWHIAMMLWKWSVFLTNMVDYIMSFDLIIIFVDGWYLDDIRVYLVE